MFTLRMFVALVAAVGAGATANAQVVRSQDRLPKAEVALDYSYMRANAAPGNCGCFGMNGGSAEGAFHAYRGLSAVVDLTGEHTASTSVAGQGLSLLFITGGPRYTRTIHAKGRVALSPFVQGLVGGVHGFDAPFPNGSGSSSNSATSLALLVGGGLDVSLTRALALRPIQADYGYTRLPNNVNNGQNLLRLSVGVVLRLR